MRRKNYQEYWYTVYNFFDKRDIDVPANPKIFEAWIMNLFNYNPRLYRELEEFIDDIEKEIEYLLNEKKEKVA